MLPPSYLDAMPDAFVALWQIKSPTGRQG